MGQAAGSLQFPVLDISSANSLYWGCGSRKLPLATETWGGRMARPPRQPPMLLRASVSFHTNDEDKDEDTQVDIFVFAADKRTVVAKLTECFGHFNDHSNSGTYNLVLLKSVSRDDLREGHVDLEIVPNGEGFDAWRFNFLLDLYFSDGGHLFARANGVEMNLIASQLSVGFE